MANRTPWRLLLKPHGINFNIHNDMAYKSLGTATSVSSILKTDSVLVEVDGSIRRITLDNLMDSINTGDEMLLRQVAWGVPIKQNQSSPEWGRLGNLTLWEEYKSRCGRYLVTNDGKAVKLNRTNSVQYAEGGTINATKGHVMWIAPRLYYRVIEDSTVGYPTLWMSQIPIGGFYIGTAGNGMYNCLGAYKGQILQSTLVSRSGFIPSYNIQGTALWEAAQKNGEDWGIRDYKHNQLMMMMALSEYGSPNIQAKLGYGVCGSVATTSFQDNALTLTAGVTDSYGDSSCKISISLSGGSNCSRVSLFGIEDPYGWESEVTSGIYGGGGIGNASTDVFIFNEVVNRMPTEDELNGTPTDRTRKLTRFTGSNYIRTMVVGDYFDIVPAQSGGSNNSYWCDYASNSSQLWLSGGGYQDGGMAGLGCVHAIGFNYYRGGQSSRLAYYGDLEFVRPNQI